MTMILNDDEDGVMTVKYGVFMTLQKRSILNSSLYFLDYDNDINLW